VIPPSAPVVQISKRYETGAFGVEEGIVIFLVAILPGGV
jgi:hypothetical protein